jgi:D-aminoacyl-tRNA deacylase
MRVVLQRVSRADVRVSGRVTGAIGRGYLLLVGFSSADGEAQLRWMAAKVPSLRLFPEEAVPAAAGRSSSFSRTLVEVGGDLLVVSQFTLYGDARKGTRPSFTGAAAPEQAVPLYERFLELLRTEAPGRVESGEFGAMMEVSLVNDGPVTLVLER